MVIGSGLKFNQTLLCIL